MPRIKVLYRCGHDKWITVSERANRQAIQELEEQTDCPECLGVKPTPRFPKRDPVEKREDLD